jgi:hypothetical protein
MQGPETPSSKVPEEITTEGLPPESPAAGDERPEQSTPPAEEDPGFEDEAESDE